MPSCNSLLLVGVQMTWFCESNMILFLGQPNEKNPLIFLINSVQNLLPCLLDLTSGDFRVPLCPDNDVGVVNVHLVLWLSGQSSSSLFFRQTVPLHHPANQLRMIRHQYNYEVEKYQAIVSQ